MSFDLSEKCRELDEHNRSVRTRSQRLTALIVTSALAFKLVGPAWGRVLERLWVLGTAIYAGVVYAIVSGIVDRQLTAIRERKMNVTTRR